MLSDSEVINQLEDVINEKFEEAVVQINTTKPFIAYFRNSQDAKNFEMAANQLFDNLTIVHYDANGNRSQDLDAKIICIDWNKRTSPISHLVSYFTPQRQQQAVAECVEEVEETDHFRDFNPDITSVVVCKKADDGNTYPVDVELDTRDILLFLLQQLEDPKDLNMSDNMKLDYEDLVSGDYSVPELTFSISEFLKRNYQELIDCNKETITKVLTSNQKYQDIITNKANEEMEKAIKTASNKDKFLSPNLKF